MRAGQILEGLGMKRGSLTRFVETHRLAWEGTMAALGLAYLGLAVWSDQRPGRVPTWIGALASSVFLAEFAARLWDAPSRRGYVRSHWTDALAATPTLGILRALPAFRLLRLMVAARVLRTSDHARHRRQLTRETLWFVGPCIAVLWLGAAYAIWVLEHGVNPNIRSFVDALYWSFITMTTVGYGDITPGTTGGSRRSPDS